MGKPREKESPHIRLSNDALHRCWIEAFPDALRQAVSRVMITSSSRYYLSGVIFIRYPDKDRPGKWHAGRLAFKLVAARSLFSTSRRYVIKHFVSSITPTPIRQTFAAPFLRVVLDWLQHRGFAEVRFPIHSRRRRMAFERVLAKLGFNYQLRDRLIFQVVVVDLKADANG